MGRYSIKEIAQALELSRNTVAKVINGKPGVSKKTINRVQNFISQSEAVPLEPEEHTPQRKSIVFTYFQATTEYQNNIMTGIERVLKEKGYLVLLNIIHGYDGRNVPIPSEVKNGLADGIISFNVFDNQYWEDIISSNIPAVFIDAMYHPQRFTSRTDIVSPENNGPMYNLTNMLVEKGKTKFGYIGNQEVCYSIHQRWKAVKMALEEKGLALEDKYCIYDNNMAPPEEEQFRSIRMRLLEMEELPEVFICASDLHAILVSRALQEMNVAIPQRVSIVGCDNISETKRQMPSITTVDVYSEYLGRLAAERVIERLENPELPYAFIQNQTDIVLRESTDLEGTDF